MFHFRCFRTVYERWWCWDLVTHTHTHAKNQVLLTLHFCLKVNPLDYLFSPAAVLFISLAANIRISTQTFSTHAEKKIQYNLLIISTVSELSVLCRVQTAVLLQSGFVYNKITSWSKDTSTVSLLMLQICRWSLGGHRFLLLVMGSNAEAPFDQDWWPSAWVLQHTDMV